MLTIPAFGNVSVSFCVAGSRTVLTPVVKKLTPKPIQVPSFCCLVKLSWHAEMKGISDRDDQNEGLFGDDISLDPVGMDTGGMISPKLRWNVAITMAALNSTIHVVFR